MRLKIERLGHLGDGIAKGIFVPGGLPGEIVEGEVEANRMPAPKIVEPSPLRIKAACQHYKTCGGCSLMHVREEFVADWKVDVVHGALHAQGIEAEMRTISTSPPQSRRRAVFHGRRTKKGAVVGFHGRASGALVAIPNCILVTPAIRETIPALETLTKAGGSRSAELSLTVTETEAGPDVSVENGKPLDLSLRQNLAELAETHSFGRLSWGGETISERSLTFVRFGDNRVPLPPGAFLQATKSGENTLVSAVIDSVSGAKRIADLFSGLGTFTFPLAQKAAVHAVEGDPNMLTSLERAWRHAEGLHQVTTETRDLFRRPLLEDELARYDTVVLDPPRAGAEAQIFQISQSDLRGVTYVSCNPVTFARDAKTLVTAGWHLNWVQVVDQFRWSPHIELVAAFINPISSSNHKI